MTGFQATRTWPVGMTWSVVLPASRLAATRFTPDRGAACRQWFVQPPVNAIRAYDRVRDTTESRRMLTGLNPNTRGSRLSAGRVTALLGHGPVFVTAGRVVQASRWRAGAGSMRWTAAGSPAQHPRNLDRHASLLLSIGRIKWNASTPAGSPPSRGSKRSSPNVPTSTRDRTPPHVRCVIAWERLTRSEARKSGQTSIGESGRRTRSRGSCSRRT